jgi:paraquat-inducible protein B
VIGTGGTLDQLVEEARAVIKAADLPATARATRTASHETSLAADDLRRSLPAIRESLQQLRELAKLLEEQPESVVYGPSPPKGKSR